jgi:ADP-heptose:LPS heptosyltransferase
MNPRHILLVKSHSMGIGDLLRSSAAWQALKLRWPAAHLHLLMLSRHPGYPTEQLIREHHLLSSAAFVSVALRPDSKDKLPQGDVRREIAEKLQGTAIDLVVDCEPYGLRTTLLTRWIARQWSATSVGVAQFPTRGWFYDHAAPSTRAYARRRQLALPMDYTERDFVALAALGIERNGGCIVLAVSQDGRAWQQQHLPRPAELLRLSLNIGCGTADALPKRPPMEHLVANMVALFQQVPYELHLSGAQFERDVNTAFATQFKQRLTELGLICDVKDWAGLCSLSELTGLLGASGLVISTDSGPYHMAVALGIPTVCWFNFETLASRHRQPKVEVVIAPTEAQFVAAARAALGLA